MRTSPVIRVKSPAELLSLIPYKLGFIPDDSIVFVGLPASGKGGVMMSRIDTPAFLAPEAFESLVKHLEFLSSEGVGEIIMVSYNEAGAADDALASAAGMLSELGMLAEIWEVCDCGYRNRDRRTLRAGPWLPPEDILASRSAVEATRLGLTVAESVEDLAALPEVSPADLRAAQRSAVRATDTLLQASWTQATQLKNRSARLFEKHLGRWEAALEGGVKVGRIPPTDLGRIVALANDASGRDAILAVIIGLPLEALAVLSTADDLEEPTSEEVVHLFFDPGICDPMPWARSIAATELLRLAAAHATVARRGAVLHLAGWVAWRQADTAHLRILLDAADRTGGETLLGSLLRTLYEHGVFPPQRKEGSFGEQ